MKSILLVVLMCFVCRCYCNWQLRGGSRAGRLARIAREALLDGIIGEGDAAKRAERRRDTAKCEVEARVENAIVVEESRHASLAEDVLMWARREGASVHAA